MRITRQMAERLGLDYDALWRQAAPISPISEKSHTRVSRVAVPGEPRLLSAVAGDGWWECEIAEFCPASKNLKTQGWWKWHAARKRDDAAVGLWAADPAGPPRATGKRRLWLTVRRKSRRGSLPDPLNLQESVADACVNCGLLARDSSGWIDFPTPDVDVDSGSGWAWVTMMRLEDI